uniref:Fucosyltransferase C-terminal domain-containing protein n=1 Tax=viral metagenome TaxID=1070528 RepID=A0A6C0HAZ4_9ZZZZ
MKYIIKLFSDFTTPTELKKMYENICQVDKLDYYGKDKEIYLTDGEDYTHVLILNNATPELKNIPKENVVGLANEPPVYLTRMFTYNRFIEYANANIHKYFMGDNSLPAPFIEKYSYMLHMAPLPYIPKKNKFMSIIVSQKSLSIPAVGYKYRLELLTYILNSELPIDIYGRICKSINKPDERIKGEFKDYEPYENYQFHICIENFMTNAYVSEKVINPLLTNTVPIYLGCHNIDKYFGDNVIKMTGDLQKDIMLINDIVINPEKYQKNIDMEFIKSKTSLIQNIKEIFA